MTHRGLVAAATALLMAAGATACRSKTIESSGPKPAAPTELTKAQAEHLLEQARRGLYGAQPPRPEAAIHAADKVINTSGAGECVWAGYVLKAAALEELDRPADAAEAAGRGIEHLLASPASLGGSPPAILNPAAEHCLKQLLIRYVDNILRPPAPEQEPNIAAALTALRAWEQAFIRSYTARSADHAGAAQAEATRLFGPPAITLQQFAASGASETMVQAAIEAYVVAFNAGDATALLKVIEAESPLARDIAAKGLAVLSPAQSQTLHVASAVRVVSPKPRATGAEATATCDLLVTSRAGWARKAPGVTFTLVPAKTGGWRIRSITGHP